MATFIFSWVHSFLISTEILLLDTYEYFIWKLSGLSVFNNVKNLNLPFSCFLILCVCVCWHLCVCTGVWCWVSFLVAFHLIYLSRVFHLNPDLIHLVSLASLLRDHFGELIIIPHWHTWVLGIRTLVLILVWQTFYLMNYLYIPYLLIYAILSPQCYMGICIIRIYNCLLVMFTGNDIEFFPMFGLIQLNSKLEENRV